MRQSRIGIRIIAVVLVLILMSLAMVAVQASIVLSTPTSTVKPTTPIQQIAPEKGFTVVGDCTPVWKFVSNKTIHPPKIVVDLSHAERIMIDNVISPNLDRSKNSRIFDWQAWADDMRANGYVVDLIRTGPISEASLKSYDLLIIAQPDNTVTGPAYFLKDEVLAISNFVNSGNSLLLLEQQFMGGQTAVSYAADYTGSYSSDLIENKLLTDLALPMRFTSGNTKGSPHDLLVSDDPVTQIDASIADIWIKSGSILPLSDQKFAAFHSNSVIPNGASEVVKADGTVYTVPKNQQFTPVLQPKGSLPVLIAMIRHGCGNVAVYGDPSAWQTRSANGEIYKNARYNEQKVARSLIKILTESGDICTLQTPASGTNCGVISQIPLPVTTTIPTFPSRSGSRIPSDDNNVDQGSLCDNCKNTYWCTDPLSDSCKSCQKALCSNCNDCLSFCSQSQTPGSTELTGCNQLCADYYQGCRGQQTTCKDCLNDCDTKLQYTTKGGADAAVSACKSSCNAKYGASQCAVTQTTCKDCLTVCDLSYDYNNPGSAATVTTCKSACNAKYGAPQCTVTQLSCSDCLINCAISYNGKGGTPAEISTCQSKCVQEDKKTPCQDIPYVPYVCAKCSDVCTKSSTSTECKTCVASQCTVTQPSCQECLGMCTISYKGQLTAEEISTCQSKCVETGTNTQCQGINWQIPVCNECSNLCMVNPSEQCTTCQNSKCAKTQSNCNDCLTPCFNNKLSDNDLIKCVDRCKNTEDGTPCLTTTVDVSSCATCLSKCDKLSGDAKTECQSTLSSCTDEKGILCSKFEVNVLQSCEDCMAPCDRLSGTEKTTCQSICKTDAGTQCLTTAGAVSSCATCLSKCDKLSGDDLKICTGLLSSCTDENGKSCGYSVPQNCDECLAGCEGMSGTELTSCQGKCKTVAGAQCQVSTDTAGNVDANSNVVTGKGFVYTPPSTDSKVVAGGEKAGVSTGVALVSGGDVYKVSPGSERMVAADTGGSTSFADGTVSGVFKAESSNERVVAANTGGSAPSIVGVVSGIFRPSFMSNSTTNQSTMNQSITNKTGKNVTIVVKTKNVTTNVTKK